jgi:hypothetical protein
MDANHNFNRGVRVRNGCRGRIADMTVPEASRVDTDGGIKPDMAFLAPSRGNIRALYESPSRQNSNMA